MTTARSCRWCASAELVDVLDLGAQPTADLFPPTDAPAPDPVWPLAMACCARCGLVQLISDPGVAEQPLGIEPRAMVEQATDAVARVRAAGLLGPGVTFAEFDSPHGGSWQDLLVAEGCVASDGPAELVVDVFGLMHDADQAAALAQRVQRLGADGSLLLQFHSLESIVRQGQWNALRHGHMAYYSTRWLASALASYGLAVRRAWTFELYGGTVLLEAVRSPGVAPDPTLAALLTTDDAQALTRPAGLATLADGARSAIDELRGWLLDHREAGRTVFGYAAASRAVPLLVAAGIGPDLLPAVADGSPGKQGRALPGSRIPIVSPADLVAARPDVVLVFVPDIVDEVRRSRPEIERAGGRWAVSEPRPRLV